MDILNFKRLTTFGVKTGVYGHQGAPFYVVFKIRKVDIATMFTSILPIRLRASWALLATLMVCLGWGLLVTRANIDLKNGRYVLFMDERITFDGVGKILHPESLKSFFDAVVDGNDQRYGRSLWYVAAACSWLPDLIWGEPGRIVATRMMQFFCIILSVYLLAWSLLTSGFLRIIFFLVVFSLPYSEYYVSMPKPEPLQLLFFSLFIFYFKKMRMQWGWPWIFLGLSFGTKISFLPLVLIFFLTSWLFVDREGDRGADDYKRAFFWFYVGLALAVPILLVAVPTGLFLYFLFVYVSRLLGLQNNVKNYAFLFSAIVSLLVSKRQLKVWFKYTFLNTTHGADQSDVTPYTWLSYYLNQWLEAPQGVSITFVVLSFLLLVLTCFTALNWKAIEQKKLSKVNVPLMLIIFFCGLSLILSIFLKVHRLWGFYLWTGTVLMLVGILSMIESSFINEQRKSLRLLRVQKITGTIVGTLLVVLLAFWLPSSYAKLKQLSERTQSEDFKKQNTIYWEVMDFFNALKTKSGETIKVVLDPVLFPVALTTPFETREFWGPYVEWENRDDYLVFGVAHTPSGTPYREDSTEYYLFLREKKSYSEYVVEPGQSCQHQFCYERVKTLSDGGEILKKRN